MCNKETAGRRSLKLTATRAIALKPQKTAEFSVQQQRKQSNTWRKRHLPPWRMSLYRWSQRQESPSASAPSIRFGASRPLAGSAGGRSARPLSSAPPTGFDSGARLQKARLRRGTGPRKVYGASDRNRTRNPLITNQLLYR